MPIREVTVYETADLKRHDTVKKAEEHLADATRAALDDRLKVLPGTKFTQNDKFTVVMALVPDFASAVALRDALNALMPSDFYQ